MIDAKELGIDILGDNVKEYFNHVLLDCAWREYLTAWRLNVSIRKRREGICEDEILVFAGRQGKIYAKTVGNRN